MTEQDQIRLGKTLWAIADELDTRKNLAPLAAF
jgi:hypothetical protein